MRALRSFRRLLHTIRPTPELDQARIYTIDEIQNANFTLFKVRASDKIVPLPPDGWGTHGSWFLKRTLEEYLYLVGQRVRNLWDLSVYCDASVHISKEVRDSVTSASQENTVKGSAYISVVAWDKKDYVVSSHGGSIGEHNIPCSELTAIYKGLKVVKESSAQNSIVWSDSRQAVRVVNAREINRGVSGCQQLLRDTRSLLHEIRKSGKRVELAWCRRIGNRLADCISQTVKSEYGRIVLPRECHPIYKDDKKGLPAFQFYDKRPQKK